MNTLKIILFSFLFFLSFTSFSFSPITTPPGDTPYLRQKVSNGLEFLFSDEYKKQSLYLHKKVHSINNELKKGFNYFPYYNTNSIVFVSSHKQASNAGATVTPLPSVFINFPSFFAFNQMGFFDWTLDVLIHEMTHTYQIAAQTQYSYWSSFLFPYWVWLVYPNSYSHSLILEGNAILHESIYGSGGRLFSGFTRAFVFAQLKANISIKRLIHHYQDSFSSLEKYSHGAYFQAYLHSKSSLKKVNDFFDTSKNLYIVPPLGLFNINRAYKKTEDSSFPKLLKNYKDHYKPIANKQQTAKGKIILSTQETFPLNSDDEKIYFLSTDLKNPTQLAIFNKKKQNLSLVKKDLPYGKIFLIDGDYHSASSSTVTTTKQQITLFKEGYRPVKKYLFQYVMDISKNKTLSLDAKNSVKKIRLLVNGNHYDNIHSSAIMNPKEDIYYFKNKQSRRILYKNKKPIWSFNAYNGFPIEADNKGVYYIAPTRYGSGLFFYSEKHGNFRLSPSDTIIDARKINNTQMLVVEISPNSYEYKIIDIKKTREKPYLYKYSFKKKKISEKNLKLMKHDPKLYNPLKHWNIIDGNFIVMASNFQDNWKKWKPTLYASLNFIDNLQVNTLDLETVIGSLEKNFSANYLSRKYRLLFSIKPSYKSGVLSLKSNLKEIETLMDLAFLKDADLKKPWEESKIANATVGRKNIRFEDRSLKTQFNYPIIKRANWKFLFVKKINIGQRKFNKNTQWVNYIDTTGGLSFIYKKKYPFAFSDYRKIKLTFLYDLLQIKRSTQYKSFLTTEAHLFYNQEIIEDLYFFTKLTWKKNLKNRKKQQLFNPGKETPSASFHSFKQTVQNLKQMSFNIQKIMNTSFYYEYFPIALSRWAPFIGSSFVLFEDKSLSENQNYILNTYLGTEFEIIANYRVPLQFGLSLGYLWEWKDKIGENKGQLNGGVYLKARF